MQIGTRFSIAIHLLLAVEVFKETRKVTSEFIASSVNTNPVVIRRIMGLLGKAGLIETSVGTGGIRLARGPEAVSLLDIYSAAAAADERLFRIHPDPAQACPVGGNIEGILARRFREAQEALERNLAETSLADLLEDLERRMARKD